jgi:alpha-1,2-mannosyltransferase
MIWTPIPLMPEHRETAASLWRQLAGGSYAWWAIAMIVVSGTVVARRERGHDAVVDDVRVPAVS